MGNLRFLQPHILVGKTAWERNPFNPANNSSYSESESGLFEIFRSNEQEIINPFFNTVLPLPEPFNFETRPMVLAFQQKFVDILLSVSLKYDHVLYSIDDETQADPMWSVYWSQYIRRKAVEQITSIEITEMFDPFDPTGGAVKGALMQSPSTHFFTLRSNVSVTLNDPENFSFIEISNHNAQVGQVHYETTFYIWNKVQESEILRPINNTKNIRSWRRRLEWVRHRGPRKVLAEYFCRDRFCSFSSPTHWHGQQRSGYIANKSMLEFTGTMDFFNHRPSSHLITNREENEAYCLAIEGEEYAVYFPGEGEVKINIPEGKYEIRWLNIHASEWSQAETVQFAVELKTPSVDQWAVFIKKAN